VSFYSYKLCILLSRSQFHVIYDCSVLTCGGTAAWSIASWYSAVIAALGYWSLSGLSCSTLLVDIFLLFACITLLLLRFTTLHIGVARQKGTINSHVPIQSAWPTARLSCQQRNSRKQWMIYTKLTTRCVASVQFLKPNIVVKLLRGHRYYERKIRLVYKSQFLRDLLRLFPLLKASYKDQHFDNYSYMYRSHDTVTEWQRV